MLRVATFSLCRARAAAASLPASTASIQRRSFHPQSQHQQRSSVLHFSDEVKTALEQNKPIVALESTIISHGMPYPQNYETALQVEDIVRQNGATPATIAILNGQIQIGLSQNQIQNLAELGREAVKASRRDLAVVMARKQTGATTVSATMLLAHQAGIPIFATGGIGGVHRGYEETMDASADLTELGRTPVTVVCAGVKSILDIGRTLEFLETQGVTVATYGQTTDFPAFFTRKSGFQSLLKVETPSEAANLIAANKSIGLQSGIVLAVPIPKEFAMDDKVVGDAINTAVRESVELNVLGKESTPFLLKRVNELTGGNSLKSNIALVKQNAAVAARIAKDLKGFSQARSYSTSARNLNRQGNDKGQGSPLTHGPIMVIGGTVVDITSTASPIRLPSGKDTDLILQSMMHSSHPGSTRISLGGVGRNVAEVVSKLDNQNCVFVSAVGGNRDATQGLNATDDIFGQWFVSEMGRRGMDNHEIHAIDGARTATYTAIHDSTGNLLSAVADMGVFELLPPSKIKEAMVKHQPKTVCFDANISVDCMRTTLEACRGKDVLTFFEPTSVAKCGRVLDKSMSSVLRDGLLNFATPNEFELQEMATHAKNLLNESPVNAVNQRFLDTNSALTRTQKGELQSEYNNLLLDAFWVSQFIPTLFIKRGAKGILVFSRTNQDCSIVSATPTTATIQQDESNTLSIERWDSWQTEPTLSANVNKGDNGHGFSLVWRSFPAHKVTDINSVTGAGDSLVGSVVTSLHHMHDIRSLKKSHAASAGWREEGSIDWSKMWQRMEQVIHDAQTAATLTMQTHETVSPALSFTSQAQARLSSK